MKTRKYILFALAALLTASCMDDDWKASKDPTKGQDSYGNQNIFPTNVMTVQELKNSYSEAINSTGKTPISSITSQKNYRTNIIDTSSDKIRSSKGLERWAAIRNMQEASRMINLLTEKGVSSPDEIDDKLMQLHENRLRLADRLNDLQSEINNSAELVGLLETFRDLKPMYSQYKEVRSKEKFRKEHSSEISKYESAVRQLKDLFPDNRIPKLETEKGKMKELIGKRDQLNQQYKEIKKEIEELEVAKQSVDEYLDTQRKNELDL